ncbi:MAG TPA: type VI secretion system ATPase TssH, partial [Gammaproteobacteria bacterium]|nr:type VI secretion system ATPase TssH [Gammaproteobacteria bacterium]
ILMMRGMASTMEQHHRVQILDEALEAAVKLSHRYIPARQLPDKAVSLLDTASARVAISLHAVPAEVEDCRRRIEALNTELEIIGRETAVGIDTVQRQTDANEKLQAEQVRLTELDTRWQEEKGLVDQILELRAKLRNANGTVEADPVAAEPDPERPARLAELKDLQTKLHALQGEKPLILPDVDAQAVA